MELLRKHFDTALESPDGIKKLRELILTLAMQGKLVKQDPNDKPASELLKEIQAEKERLIKEGKIKRGSREAAKIAKEEVPYEVPEGWVWCYLPDIANSSLGKMLDKQKNKGKLYPYLRNSNVRWFNFNLTDLKQIKVLDCEFQKYSARKGDLLLCEGGYPGRGAIWQSDEPIVIQKAIHRVRFFIIEQNIWFLYFLYLIDTNRDIVNFFTGAGIQHLTGDKLKTILIPLPPLAEQKRIVAKIDELMVLCDRLEAQRKQRKEKILAVHRSAIHHLVENPNSSSSPLRAFAPSRETSFIHEFIFNHFTPLYSVKENVAELKKAILTMAMQGKLVKQDPKDQPASELLKEIRAEKEKVSREGAKTRRNGTELPPIKPEEVPYEVPEGWVWCRLGEICEINGGFAFKSSAYVNKGIRVIRISDFDEKGFKNDKIVRHPFSDKLKDFELKENNILMAMTGGTVGKSLLVENLPEVMFVNQRVATIRIFKNILPNFLYSHIQTDIVQDVIQNSKNSTNDNISMNDIQCFLIPLPPLAEQKRIVAKIDELMALCDKLENQIDQSTAKQTALFDAVLAAI